MSILIQRLLDDGYGNIYVIEEATLTDDFQKTLSEMYDQELVDFCINNTIEKEDVNMGKIGNPRGYGNDTDEYRIYFNGELFKISIETVN